MLGIFCTFFALLILGEIHGIRAIDPGENEVENSHHSTTQKAVSKSPVSELHDEVDILKLLNVTAKEQGVSLVEGPIPGYPAYKFRLPHTNTPLANSSRIIEAMQREEEGFTAVFLYRQQKRNLGTLISINSPGRLTPWFQMTSNSRAGVIAVKYRASNGLPGKSSTLIWPLAKHHRKSPLAAWSWLAVSVSPKNRTIRLDLDCEPSREEHLSPRSVKKSKAQSPISIPSDSLVYFKQEPGRKKKFLGSMQAAKILPYVSTVRPWTCMQISHNLTPELRKPLI